MVKNLYNINDYREFLRQEFPVKGEKRGIRTQLAKHLRCHTGFVTNAIAGETDFTLDHAIQIAQFLGLTSDEQDYFLLLVHRDRAGHHALKEYYTGKLELIRAKHKEVRSRVSSDSHISDEDRYTYYLTWYYLAIHMCTMSPHLQKKEAIAKYLGLSLETVGEVLEFLQRTGLVELKNGLFRGVYGRFHLPSDSPLIKNHHANWRAQALEALDRKDPGRLNYSGVLCISKDATEKIRELMLKLIQDAEPIIRDAKDEDLTVISMDLFSLKKGNL